MKKLIVIALATAVIALSACSSDPQWADPMAHLKTEEMKALYGEAMVGNWNRKYQDDKNRYFEQLHFSEDGKVVGTIKWAHRSKVTVDGEEKWTDWETDDFFSGTFEGSWRFFWHDGEEKLYIYAAQTDESTDDEWNSFVLFSGDYSFAFINDNSTLCIEEHLLPVSEKGVLIEYERGKAEPDF